LLVEGVETLAAASAVVVGASAGNVTAQADQAVATMAVIGGGVVAVRAA
jgi:hypothetical protein